MSAPPLLTSAALLFWGWQTGIVMPALALAAICHAPSLTRARWEFDETDFRRAADISVLLFVISAILCFALENNVVMALLTIGPLAPDPENIGAFRAAFILFQWLPILLFPIVAVQALSNAGRVPLSAIFWLLRRQGGSTRTVNVSYAYYALCLAAGAAANRREVAFYLAFFALVAWPLWQLRPRRYPAAAWAALLAGALAVGYAGAIGLNRLQAVVENSYAHLTAGLFNVDGAESVTRTSMGDIGQLKLSGKIVMEVHVDGSPPALLRDGVYDNFTGAAWSTQQRDFSAVTPAAGRTIWRLTPAPQDASARAEIAIILPGGRRVLALPAGAHQLNQLPVAQLTRNAYGTVEAAEGPGLVRFAVDYAASAAAAVLAPTKRDLTMPGAEADAIAAAAAEIGLDALPTPTAKARAIEAWFANHFDYSLELSANGVRQPGTTALTSFLQDTRAGHCEFFATAAALLLRHAGVPARYVTGYAVQEEAAWGDYYVVRRRHGHAWCSYFDGTTWLECDGTPAGWMPADESRASAWEPVSDLASTARYRFSLWLAGLGKAQPFLAAALALLLGFLIWGLLRRGRRRVDRAAEEPPRPWPGSDSAFYEVEAALAAAGVVRGPAEPLSTWVPRAARVLDVAEAPLQELLALHYRLRFDSAACTDADHSHLRSGVRSWLATYQAAQADSG
jgi:transglutaminase-like putative cysteine protease